MRKITLLFSLLLAMVLITKAESGIVLPEGGKRYNIVHVGSNLFLGSLPEGTVDDYAKIQNPTGESDQVFTFEFTEIDSVFYIKQESSGFYLRKLTEDLGAGKDWKTCWTVDPQNLTVAPVSINDARFKLIATPTPGVVQIQNMGRNLLFGTDGTKHNDNVYGNKSDAAKTNNKLLWKIVEVTGAVNKEALQSLIAQVEEFIVDVTVGNGSDQYPAEIHEDLMLNLSEAKAIYNDETGKYKQADVTASTEYLQQSFDDFQISVNPFIPKTGVKYQIIHSSGFYFTFDGSAKVMAANGLTNQQFTFVPVPEKDNAFSIKQESSNLYLAKEGGYNLKMMDTQADTAQYIIKRSIKGYYRISCPLSSNINNCIGTDNATENSGVYSDKAGNVLNHYWRFIEMTTDTQKGLLQEKVTEIETFLADCSIGEGSDQYPSSAYNPLASALSDAKAIISDPNATLEDIAIATDALNEPYAGFKSSVHPLLPALGESYYIIHSSELYLTAEAGVPSIKSQNGTDDQKFMFLPVDGKPGTFNIKQVSSELFMSKLDGWSVTFINDPAVDTAQYVITLVSKGFYKISCPFAASAGKCIGTDLNTENGGVYSDKSGTDGKHHWKIVSISRSGIKEQNINELSVSTKDNLLEISYLTGTNRISIYTITGQLVFSKDHNDTSFSHELKAGNYILSVKGSNDYGKVIIVR